MIKYKRLTLTFSDYPAVGITVMEAQTTSKNPKGPKRPKKVILVKQSKVQKNLTLKNLKKCYIFVWGGLHEKRGKCRAETAKEERPPLKKDIS
jgi:hypothetical protein